MGMNEKVLFDQAELAKAKMLELSEKSTPTVTMIYTVKQAQVGLIFPHVQN